ncbi:MAG: hypothetical protein KGK08_05515 [Acidobacteriota bacterium]|nr:hypothetical protein [Acidobacteriota bacterium]
MPHTHRNAEPNAARRLERQRQLRVLFGLAVAVIALAIARAWPVFHTGWWRLW